MCQKYMRGYISRNNTVELLKEIHLGTNLEYFEKIRKKLMDDTQIQFRWAWKRYKKRKAKKKAKKAAAAEAAKNKKFGRSTTRKPAKK